MAAIPYMTVFDAVHGDDPLTWALSAT